MAVIKGTELPGRRTFVPGAEYGNAGPNLGRGGGSGSTVVPPTPAPIKKGVVAFRPNVGDVVENLTGTTAQMVDLSTINPAYNGYGVAFPGASGDLNTESWVNIPIPSNLAATPNLRLRLHVIVPPEGWTP